MRALISLAYNFAIRNLPPQQAISLIHLREVGRWPNLSQPRTFNEKVLASKLQDRNPLMTVCADKVAVKDYVVGLIGAEHVIPTLWSGTDLPAREARDWPNPFVVKANHASGSNHFVRSEEERDWPKIESLAKSWLAKPYDPYKWEWAYHDITPQILVEPFLGSDGVLPLDYKVFVFGGTARFVQVDVGRESGHKRCFYDRDWSESGFTLAYPLYEGDIAPPRGLDKMLSFAETLSGDFPFVRCDFYEIDGHIYFGEMTFYPESGIGAFDPPEWDQKLGEFWE